MFNKRLGTAIAILTIMTGVLTMCNRMTHAATEVLVEAESFTDKGGSHGWKVDQQFTESMGSPYLLAHGMGRPVANAKTTVSFPVKGRYHLWVRTKDWVPGDWEAPGRFQVIIAGKTIDAIFGTQSGWGWQDGGTVAITDKKVAIELHDLTGFDGRCDALYFSTDAKMVPPNDLETMRPWRNRLLGLPATPPSAGTFDVVIVGGGITGCAAALAADKQGIKVALIQDRPVYGGNNSREIRVHVRGVYGKGADILKRIDSAHWPNGDAEVVFDEEKRHQAMDAAKNVHQFLSTRAYAANTKGNRILSVDARHIETGETKRFTAPVFIDCTGDGWIGYWAGAEYRYGRESRNEFGERMDPSSVFIRKRPPKTFLSKEYEHLWSPEKPDNITLEASVNWNSIEIQEGRPYDPVEDFPEVPWAMEVAKDKEAIAGQWYWGFSSNDKHMIDDAEEIRDHMLRAIYGSFYNAKKDPENRLRKLRWVAFILGKRESRRLIGDYILTLQDCIEQRRFPDTVAEESSDIDLHYQRKLMKEDPQNKYDFISKAMYLEAGVHYIPFRCLYSKNIENLMMAGRCYSTSHVALAASREMLTCGQMGIATGYAAYLCKKYDTNPRGVYKHHLHELLKLIGYEDD